MTVAVKVEALFDAVTLTVTLFVTAPAGPLQLIVKALVLPIEPIEYDPRFGRLPVQAPDPVHVEASVEDHVRIALPPL